ncbi:MAG: c-type cytochrome [Bacteroidetes bacterium]|nr:c-type cytochrome [Bacteroidota bacterium]
MKTKLLVFLFLSIVLAGFQIAGDSLFEVPKGWPKPRYDFSKKPLSKETVELGRALFYDQILSRNNSVSCASCHSQYTAFTHVDHALSHGIDDRIGKRNSPALMNLAWQSLFMWDGAVNHIEAQALAPISNPLEMDENISSVVKKLSSTRLYQNLFYKAFGDSVITGERTLKAISQFMLTLVSSNSKYDSVMRKEASFSDQENRGYSLFKKHCSSCHTEPLFTNDRFENNGLPLDTTLMDKGRYAITQNAKDSLLFKVPTLRNIEFSYPYMHDGRLKKLSEVLKHYSNGITQGPTLSKELLNPIKITSEERVDIIAFLLTLTDKTFLFDKRFSYPKIFFSYPAKD